MLWTLLLLPALAGAAMLAAGDRARSVLGTSAALAMAVTLAAALAAVALDWTGTLQWSGALRLQVALVPVSAVVSVLVPAITLPVLIYAAAHEAGEALARLLGLLLVFAGGMEAIVIADDLLTLLVGWEIVGATSWALIGHHWRDIETPRSALYAFVTTRLGDLGLFVALMATYAATGSVAFEALAELEGASLALVAFGVLVSAAAKSGQVPFSPWLFRAMAGPTSVSALLHAAAMVAAGAYAMIRLYPWIGDAPGFGAAAVAIGLATALAGGVVALLQDHAKKLLAASTSAQLGLMFVAVGTGYPGVAVIHLVVHAAFKAPLFFAAGIAGERAGSYSLHAMGVGRALPATALLAAVAAAALAGLPPAGGGWSKETIVAAASHESLWLGLAVMVAGGLSAAYAARFQLLAFGLRKDARGGFTPGGAEIAALGALSGLTVILGALWLAEIHDPVARAIGIDLPAGTFMELAVSLAILAVGLIAGAAMARRRTGSASAIWAEWLGLAHAIDAVLVRPFTRLADMAAIWDGRAVDHGIMLTAALANACARLGSRLGEALTDELPEGTGRMFGMGGSAARGLQTGLSHHYYALAVAGLAVGIAILALGV